MVGGKRQGALAKKQGAQFFPEISCPFRSHKLFVFLDHKCFLHFKIGGVLESGKYGIHTVSIVKNRTIHSYK